MPLPTPHPLVLAAALGVWVVGCGPLYLDADRPQDGPELDATERVPGPRSRRDGRPSTLQRPEVEEPPAPALSPEALAALPPGARVLEIARVMAEVEQQLIAGSCYTFISRVYARAGFAGRGRHKIYKTLVSGPYADPALIQAGDWIMHVNQEFGGVEHSVIFIRWLDVVGGQGLTWGYVGGMREARGTRQVHLLSQVYAIYRPVDPPPRRR